MKGIRGSGPNTSSAMAQPIAGSCRINDTNESKHRGWVEEALKLETVDCGACQNHIGEFVSVGFKRNSAVSGLQGLPVS